MSENKIFVSPGPHISKPASTRSVMFDVLIALMPALLGAAYFFRMRALIVVGTCVVTCVITEWLICKIRKQRSTVGDLSAVLTAIILAFSVPPMIPAAYLIIGCIFAIAIGKMVFGGLGNNPFNPAMVGRAFLTASFGMAMTIWSVPANLNAQLPQIGPEGAQICESYNAQDLEGITQATPLAWAKNAIKAKSSEEAQEIVNENFGHSQLKATLFGYTGGCLGETSAIALIIGGIYMLIKKTITWIIPVSVLASAFIFASIFHLAKPDVYVPPLFHMFSGGLLICAFFIATDPVTNPMNPKAQALFGIGVGVIIMLIRTVGGYPEGAMFAILIMNAFTPLLDRLCKKIPVGGIPNAA